MKTKLLLEVRKVVLYYSEFKNKKNMGFPITLSDIENCPIQPKLKIKLKGKKNINKLKSI